VAVVLVVVVLGWLMPAFGVSLVAFVVVDLVVNAVRQRRERVRRTIAAGTLLAVGSVFGAAVLADPSSFVSQDDASGNYAGQGTLDGGGGAPEDGPAPGVAAPNGAPDAGMAPPTSWHSMAFPYARYRAPADVAEGTDDSSDFTTPGGDTGADRTPPAHFGPNDADDKYADGGRGIDAPAGDSTSSGDSGSPGGVGNTADDGAEVPPPPVAGTADDTTGIVDGLVGTLTDVAKPVTSLLVSVVDGVTGGRLGD
jgi:hypothetical protein